MAHLLTNFATTTVSSPVTSAGQTTIALTDVTRFPNVGSVLDVNYYYAAIQDASGVWEIIKVRSATAATGAATVTVLRGQEGSTARSSFAVGSAVFVSMTLQNFKDYLATQMASSPVISGGSINGSVIGGTTRAAVSGTVGDFNSGLTVSGAAFASRGIQDDATTRALNLTGSGPNYITIANSVGTPTISSSAGGIGIVPYTGQCQVTHSASPVILSAYAPANYAMVSIASATGYASYIQFQNNGANTGRVTVGSGNSIQFATGTAATLQVLISHNAAATNHITLVGSSSAPEIGTSGGGLTLRPNTGVVNIANSAGVAQLSISSSTSYAALTLNSTGANSAYTIFNADGVETAAIYSSNANVIRFATGSGRKTQFAITDNPAATNYLTAYGSNGGAPVLSDTAGGIRLITSTGLLSVESATATTSLRITAPSGTAALLDFWAGGAGIARIYSDTTNNLALQTGPTPATQLLLLNTAGTTRYISISGSVAGNPVLTTSAGALQITPAVVGMSSLAAWAGTAPPAGGGSAALYMGTTANLLGVYFGSGAPTISAGKGSLYIRTDGTTTNNRMYVATDAVGGWTAVTTVS